MAGWTWEITQILTTARDLKHSLPQVKSFPLVKHSGGGAGVLISGRALSNNTVLLLCVIPDGYWCMEGSLDPWFCRKSKALLHFKLPCISVYSQGMGLVSSFWPGMSFSFNQNQEKRLLFGYKCKEDREIKLWASQGCVACLGFNGWSSPERSVIIHTELKTDSTAQDRWSVRSLWCQWFIPWKHPFQLKV